MLIDWSKNDPNYVPTDMATFNAQRLLNYLEHIGLQPMDIYPTPENGIVMSFGANERYADIECLDNGKILGVTSMGGDNTEVFDMSEDNFSTQVVRKEAAERVRKFIMPEKCPEFIYLDIKLENKDE